MTYGLRFLPEVEDDVVAGFAWYEAKAPGLGEEFIRAFYRCVDDVPDHPLSYPRVHGDIRRCLLRRFPYATYFTVEGDDVIVAGLFHCARDPRTVGEELHRRVKP